jgi:hypothetical protein
VKTFDIEIKDERKGKPEFTEKERSELLCRMYTTPSGSNTLALCALNDSADWGAMSDRLKEVNSAVIDGDITIAEALLIDQAIVLQSVFSNFTAKMANAKYMSQIEAFSKIALRAQNQCQRTLKTLLEYKNPKRTTFIKQQNNATNQQVNDGKLKEIPEKEINPANELLEENHEVRLDTGKTQEAVRVDSELETVGELDRTSHGTG